VLDRVHAGLDGDAGGGVSVAVRRDLAAPLVRLGDDGRHFLQRELRHVDGIGFRKHPAACGDLDEVGAPLHLVAHRFAALFRPAANALDRPPRLHFVGREGVVIEMPTG